MIAIAGGILLAAMLLGVLYIAYSMTDVNPAVGWTAVAIVLGICAWVIF